MTRGLCGSLTLQSKKLSFSTLHRFCPGAPSVPVVTALCAINSTVSAFGDEIDTVIANLNDSNVKKIDLNPPNWNGSDGHPDLNAHQSMAATLAARLQAELGW